MWDRASIKAYAKAFLKRHYWKAFLAVLIVTLISGGADNGFNIQWPLKDNFRLSGNYYDPSILTSLGSSVTKSPLFIFGAGFLSITTLIISILMITVGFAIEVGKSRFFLDGFKGDVSISKLFSTFNEKEYIPIVKAQFMRWLYTFLWSLLFIIPGIIKGLEYRFVPYILAEDSSLTPNQALSKSKAITYGHKMDIFVLDLSFIGWYILGAIPFGLGVFFVNPYAEATNARLYNVLKGEAGFGYDYDETVVGHY